jgi:LmbE family N-acetylglucosaminyl deacetylase
LTLFEVVRSCENGMRGGWSVQVCSKGGSGVKRLCAFLAAVLGTVLIAAGAAQAAPAPTYTAGKAVKINVMGEWAHPDDDTSIIGPCGVWHQRYGVKCGIIMVTRGEGGGNGAGTEIGPALGLRRENEDRVAHYRSGTVDIFNLDRVDFFYNLSAPLTQYFWRQDETLRRITRIIRMTQPDIYIGFNPTIQGAGHGNHQQAGRYIWEGMKAAADPNMFPEQLTGPGALSTWQVKKVFSGGSTAADAARSTANAHAANCTAGFIPASTNLDTVAGVWLGYDSPYKWAEGNVQGRPGGTPKSWAQVTAEGRVAYPTQSRVMAQGTAVPSCAQFGQTYATVPFQRNVNADGSANPNAGKDDAILYGATVQDPGGLPLGTTERLTFSRFYNVPGEPFQATLRLKAGSGLIGAGRVDLTVPTGWTVDAASKPLPATGTATETAVTFTVTPSAGATLDANAKIAAVVTSGSMTGYTDNVVRIVPSVEGRLDRFGTWAEYDRWAEGTMPEARRLGRSAAVESIGVGETKTLTVNLHNWSTAAQTGRVTLTLPANYTATPARQDFVALAPGADASVTFDVTNTDATLPGTPTATIDIVTTVGAASSTERMTMAVVPTTTIPEETVAPRVDGTYSAGEYTGERLDIGRYWEGGKRCAPDGVDCGSSGAIGGPTSSWAQVSHRGDALYFWIHVQDDYQGYAVTPTECVAHWLADSVEILIDPRGNANVNAFDTANTFKLGIFPYTNDPEGRNGNGVNGPCWSRDADNHQGYSTGPLAAGVTGAPNAAGVEVKSTARWAGSNETTVDHSYAGGGYDLEVKIPMAALPAAVDPANMGLNITPYDNDNNAAGGTTTLRHIDINQTRLAWSAINGVQAAPYRWGHARVAGYTPPAGRPVRAPAPTLTNGNLDGTTSPQTIAQSARDGVPIAGRTPAPAGNSLTVTNVKLTADGAELDVTSTGTGTARVYLWSGLTGSIPVYTSSCAKPSSETTLLDFASYGLDACDVTDGGYPAWGSDQSGRVVAERTLEMTAGTQHVTIPLDAAGRAKLAADGTALVSYLTPADEVQALALPLAQAKLTVSAADVADADGPGEVELRARVVGTDPFPGAATGTVQFQVDGVDVGAPVKVDARGHAERTTTTIATPQGHTVTARYSGDGDYVARSATYTARSTAGPQGPQGPQGPAGPKASEGRKVLVGVTCSVAKGRTVKCTVKESRATSKSSKLKASIRLVGTRKSATRTARGTVKLAVNAGRRVTKAQKVLVTVTKDGKTVRKTIKATGRATLSITVR